MVLPVQGVVPPESVLENEIRVRYEHTASPLTADETLDGLIKQLKPKNRAGKKVLN